MEERHEKAFQMMKAKIDAKVERDEGTAMKGRAQPKQVESWLDNPDQKLEPKMYNPYKQQGPDDLNIYDGARRQGKTFTARENLHATRHWYRCGEVFTNTKFNGFWQKIFPEQKVFMGWRPGMMQKILEEQAYVVSLYERYPEKVNPYRVLVLDDVANEVGQDPVLDDLAAYARHLKLSVHFLTQHPQKAHPIVRSNADIVFVFPMHNRAALEVVADDYLPMLRRDRALEVLTTFCWKEEKQSQSLVIHNRTGNTVKERVFCNIAKDPGPFTIGCKEYWEGLSTVPDIEELQEGEDADEDENADDLQADLSNPEKHSPPLP